MEPNPLVHSNDAIWRLARVAIAVLAAALLCGAIARFIPACDYVPIASGLFWGPVLGPAFTVGFFARARGRSWPEVAGRAALTGGVILVVSALVLPNYFSVIARWKRQAAMRDLGAIGAEIVAGRDPGVRKDPWGNPYVTQKGAGGYTVISYGLCGEPDVPPGEAYTPGVTRSPKDDLVFSNGIFVRYPEGETP